MEKLLRPKKVCEILDIHPTTLQRWDREGIIEVKRLPFNKRRVSESEVERILNNGKKKPKPLSTKFKILSANSPIEDHLHYSLQEYPTKKKDVEIQKLCKLIEINTKYKFTDIVEKFNDLYREGIIFNEGGTKKSHLVFADVI
jgi:hypothetical protein